MKIIMLSIAVSLYMAWLLYNNLIWGVIIIIPVYIILKKYMSKRRYDIWKKEILIQFEEMLRSLATALQVGYSLENAFKELKRQLADMYGEDAGIIKELKVICHGLSMNIPIEKLLYQMAQRTGLSTIMEYAEIVNVAKHSGGNLIEITRHNADIIHQRRQVITEIETMAAAKKYESMVMNMMPMGMLIYLRVTSKAYIAPLYSNITGNLVMTVLVILYIFAAWLGNYITDFDRVKKPGRNAGINKKVRNNKFFDLLITLSERTVLKNRKRNIDEEIRTLWINSEKKSLIKNFWGNTIMITFLAIAAGVSLICFGLVNDRENIALYLIITGAVVVAVPYWKIHKIREQCEERCSQMLLDYPELLDRLSLLLGAGLSVKGSFKRIAVEYRTKLESGAVGFRYVYEEIVYMVRQLDNGKPEAVVYDEWGRRSKMPVYMKLSSIITQNLRKGSRDMLDKFRMMSLDALEERNVAMKRVGEKASSKLLIPMMIQFTIVLVIIMYPAIVNL